MVVWSLAFLLKLDRDGRGPTHARVPVRWDGVNRPLPASGTPGCDAGPEGGLSSCNAASASETGSHDDT